MTGLEGYFVVVVLIAVVVLLCAAIIGASHLIGPKRHGAVKDSTYESGVDPLGDARKRFNVRYYLVAVMFLIFDVEIIFLFPWAALFPRLNDADKPGAQHHAWAAALTEAGYGMGFFAVSIGLFFLLLTVGFVYEWRKGIFRWD